MDCAERVRATVCQIENVKDCQVDLSTGMLSVTYSGGEDDRRIKEALKSAGHSLLEERHPSQEAALVGFMKFLLSQQATTLTVVSGILGIMGLAGLLLPWEPVSTVIFFAAILTGGYPIAKRAWGEVAVARMMGINALMVLAVIGASAIGEWAEAAIVVILFSLGEAMEGFAADRARGALDSLLELAPPTAFLVLPDGDLQQTGVEKLKVGDKVLIRPGDRVSVDGVVLSGASSIDQSPITGESMPAGKAAGDDVYAGSINGEGALTVEVTRLAADNTLNRMVKLVQQARSRQAPIQRFIDRFARVYTPVVAVFALLAAAVPPLFFGQPFLGDHGWLMRALQMLVIACPCALVISTPVSMVSAMTNAASRGVLIKGGRYLDALGRIGTLAFDKTGTLTLGKPTATDVLEVCTCGNCPKDCGLQHAASLEAHSSHPLALAVLSEARARNLPLSPARDVSVLSGQGLMGTVNNSPVTVANHAHFDAHYPHSADVCKLADNLAQEGKTVVMVQHDNQVCGLLAFSDTLRPESKQVVEAVQAMGIQTYMLTGDNRTVADSIGRQVGVDRVEAELLPDEKMERVAALSRDHGMVAMVGDGINDAPALARADVGIAMGGAASQQAMETADVVLLGEGLSQLPFILQLSHRTRRLVQFNIAFALAVKIVIFALAAAGIATLWMAIVADVGASVAVILNGMRLRKSPMPATSWGI